jgi:signal recognition particle subunit SRP68
MLYIKTACITLISDCRFVHLFLLTAERAWAHGMYMKSSHAEDSSSKRFPGSTRSHIVSRLEKAYKQANLLRHLLEPQSTSRATDIDLLEARAYASYLSGSAEFEKHSTTQGSSDTKTQREKWQECLENLSVAHVIYGALYEKTRGEPFREMLGSAIDPSIRYAAYQSQIPRTVAITEVARRYFPQDDSDLVRAVESVDRSAFKSDNGHDSTGNLPKTISWRSRNANIVDASIGQALVAVRTAEERLVAFLASGTESLSTGKQAAAYDEVLIASQDAVDMTRHAIDEHEKEKISESDPRIQDLRVTNLVVNYDLIGWRVGRNRVLIGGRDGVDLDALPVNPPRRLRSAGQEWTKKAEGRGRKLARVRDRNVLYDAILQSIDSVKDLRGAVRDFSFVEELDGKRAYFQALK